MLFSTIILPFYICAVTKEKVPDLKIIEIPPIRCEHCDYCKATKKITRVISAEELLLID